MLYRPKESFVKVAFCWGAVIHFPPLPQNTEDSAGGRFLGVCPDPKGKRSLVTETKAGLCSWEGAFQSILA